jgi:hypothetical protein
MLCSAIDRAISDMFSMSVKESFYLHLREDCGISREDIPYALETLSSAMKKAFGSEATVTIDRAAARNLYGHLGLRFDDHLGFTLSNYVNQAKEQVRSGAPNSTQTLPQL